MLESSVTGADGVTRSLEEIMERVDLRKFYGGPVASLWHKRQKIVFDERLTPLSEETVRIWKKRTPMVTTGALRTATTKYTPIKADRDTATFGIPKANRVKWIGVMHATKTGSRPKRDVVPNWSRAEKLVILDKMTDWIMRGKIQAQ
ncbi:MAG: hypothetical protein RLZZ621_1228 [Gemmatimonadota bacterium]|jgi:hypothetical protein